MREFSPLNSVFNTCKIFTMKQLLLILTLFLSVQSFAQKQSLDPGFDMATFMELSAEAEWLCFYDKVAWISTDEVMKLPKEKLTGLGAEWFCLPDKDDNWHAFYGKFEEGKYNAGVHVEFDEEGKPFISEKTYDQTTLNLYAQALKTAGNTFHDEVGDWGIRFNQYIRQEEDETFKIWFLPAFQPDGTAVYGAEYIYSVSKDGKELLNKESKVLDDLLGYRDIVKLEEVELNYTQFDEPTLMGVFFVMYYQPYVDKIYLYYGKGMSTLVGDDQSVSWIHIPKETATQEEKKEKPKKKRKKKKK